MKRIYFKIVGLLLVVLTLSSTAQGAVLYDQLEINFRAARQADEYQNVLDPNEVSNYDTWDPVPEGVWFGGWTKETKARADVVPDTDFEIAFAQVCLFGPEIIMSGAARTLVRLPMATTDEPWTSALLYLYEINRGTNWTFSRNVTERDGDSTPHALNDMRINFTSSSHELIYWSQEMDPTDTSKTDDNDHFTRSNRTYCYVDAPIRPSTYYLFITYVWYDSDDYVDFYLEPDSLDTTGSWNRSTVAYYNEEAPDLYEISVNDLNLSLGYSFDFVNGFGNSAYGLNQWFEAEDRIEFWTYIDPNHVNTSHYLTFMMPYRSSVPNLTWNVTIYAIDFDVGTSQAVLIVANYPCTDFILVSMQDAFSNNISINWSGWIKVYLTVRESTRLWLPLWDVPFNDSYAWSDNWFFNMNGPTHPELNYPATPDGSFNLMQYVEIQRGGLEPIYHYFWMVQHSVQFNDYYWLKTSGSTPGTEVADETSTMTFAQRTFYGMGTIFLEVITGEITPVIVLAGDIARATTMATNIIMKYVTGDLLSLAGTAYDWILRIGFPIYAFARLLETLGVTADGLFHGILDFLDATLGIIIFILAMVALFVPIYFTVKGGMAFRKAVLGDLEGASQEIQGAATTALSGLSAVGKAIPRKAIPRRK